MKRASSNPSTSAVPRKKPSPSAVPEKKPSTTLSNAEFKNNHAPPHHFHLGGENYVVVSDFGNNLNVHIRKFRMTERGNILPTKNGVSFSPFVWESLSNDIETLPLPSDSGEIAIICDTLFLATTFVENQRLTSIQKYILKKDSSRQFLPSMSMLSDREWDQLQSIREKVSESCRSLMYDNLLKQKILAQVQTRSPPSPFEMEQKDIDLILSTSLTEVLSKHLSEKIQEVFVCKGCRDNQANQLAHECVTMDNETKNSLYGQLALMSIDLESLAKDFIDQNIQMINYIDNAFVKNINIESLVENAAEMYISSDTLHYRMF